MEIYVKYIFLPYFFLVLKHMILSDVDFTRIAASNTANDDVTN